MVKKGDLVVLKNYEDDPRNIAGRVFNPINLNGTLAVVEKEPDETGCCRVTIFDKGLWPYPTWSAPSTYYEAYEPKMPTQEELLGLLEGLQ